MDGIWTGYGWDMPEDIHGWCSFFSFPPASPYGILPLRGQGLPQLAPVNVSASQPPASLIFRQSIASAPNRTYNNIQQTHCNSSYHTYKTNGRTNQRENERENQSHASEIVSRPPRRIFVTKPPSREPPWPPRTARRSPIRDRQTTSFFTRRTFDGSTTRRRCPRIARSPSPRNRVPPSPPPSCRSWPPSTTSRRAG